MKVTAKKNFSRYNKQRTETGGGPPSSPPTDIDQEIYTLIPSEFKVFDNPFDDDHQEEEPFQDYQDTSIEQIDR